MEHARGTESWFSDAHEVVRTVCVWSNRACYRIEIIKRIERPDGLAYGALVWTEEEQGERRVLVRDVTSPWVHSETAEAALGQALESLADRLRYPSHGDTEI